MGPFYLLLTFNGADLSVLMSSCWAVCLWSVGALGAEGLHRGRVPARESQRCCGDYAWGTGGAHNTPTPATTSSGLQPPITIQMVHSDQGETTVLLTTSHWWADLEFIALPPCNLFCVGLIEFLWPSGAVWRIAGITEETVRQSRNHETNTSGQGQKNLQYCSQQQTWAIYSIF